jgi:hypothetical protein
MFVMLQTIQRWRALLTNLSLQAFELANKLAFRNCLVTMRPQTTKQDLPSAHNIKMFLCKEFTKHIKGLVAKIEVHFGLSTMAGETAPIEFVFFRTSLDMH